MATVKSFPVSLRLGLATSVFLGVCTWSCSGTEQLKLPCGITGVKLHMSEKALKRVRPAIQWDYDGGAYHEEIELCKPFLTRATYDFSWWHGLTRVYLSREWEVSDIHEIEPL